MRIAQRAGRLLARRSRRAAQGGGQEGRGADQAGARQVRRARPSRAATRSKLIEELAGQIETFGRYGFNKSHSVAYSVLSYQTAWLKAHYPAEFMAALLSSRNRRHRQGGAVHQRGRELGHRGAAARRERVGLQVHRGRRQADPLRPRRGPERRARARSTRSSRRARERPVHARCTTSSSASTCGSATSGCSRRWSRPARCDGLGGHRAQLLAALDAALREAQLLQQETAAGQGSLFGEAGAGRPADGRTALPERRRRGPRPSGWRGKRRCSASTSRATRSNRFRAEVRAVRHPDHARPSASGASSRWRSPRWSPRVKRQISQKTGTEYARLTLEDFTAPPRRSSSPRPGPS